MRNLHSYHGTLAEAVLTCTHKKKKKKKKKNFQFLPLKKLCIFAWVSFRNVFIHMILLHMNHLLPQARTDNENDVLHPHSPNKLMLGVRHFMVINCWVHVIRGSCYGCLRYSSPFCGFLT